MTFAKIVSILKGGTKYLNKSIPEDTSTAI